MKGIRYMVVAMLLAAGMPREAMAQLNEYVSVEGEYKPLVVDVERINAYPGPYRFDLNPVQMQYESEGVVTDFPPSLLTMGVTGWNTTRSARKYRGYVDLGLGSWLNSNLSAGYAILADSVNSLDAALQFNSTSLYKISGVGSGFSAPSKRELYNGALMVSYGRILGAKGLLDAGIRYRLARFNYYGSLAPSSYGDLKAPVQTLNEVNARVGYRSEAGALSGWHTALELNHLAYSQYFMPDFWRGESTSGEKETELKVAAGVNLPLHKTGSFSIDAEGDFLFYPKYGPLFAGTDKSRDYGLVALRPAYNLATGNLSLRLGVRVDLTYNAMGENADKNFGTFHIAPDAWVEYRKGAVGLHAAVTGGTQLLTLLQREKFDLYQMPALATTLPQYSPLKAEAGVTVGPFSGFSAGIDFAYHISDNTPAGGWYQVMLGSDFPTASLGNPLYSFAQRGINLRGYEAGLSLGYNLSGLLSLSAKGRYVAQNGDKGIFNGYDRPRWVVETKAAVTPVKRLDIEIGYSYRGVRNIYTLVGVGSGYELEGVRLGDISELNACVRYRLLDCLSIYCRGDNLLNRKVDVLPGLQNEGLTIMGGLDFRF